MDPNEILAEIRSARDLLMRDCAGDLVCFGNLRRAGQSRWASAGNPIVSFEGQPPVELPRVDWETIDGFIGIRSRAVVNRFPDTVKSQTFW